MSRVQNETSIKPTNPTYRVSSKKSTVIIKREVEIEGSPTVLKRCFTLQFASSYLY